MRKFLIVVVILAAVAVALVLYLRVTTASATRAVTFPLSPSQRALLGSVPADADAFALVPTAAAFQRKLARNPITRGPVAEWAARQQLPRPWMLGGADLVVWRSGRQTSYAVRVDPLRAALVRVWLMLAGDNMDARSSGSTFLINGGSSAPLGQEKLDALLALGRGLPPSDAVVVQQSQSRGAFPPIGRPALTGVQVGPDSIVLTSRAASDSLTAPSAPLRPRFPEGAVVAAAFNNPPHAAEDLDRLVGAHLAHLLGGGGSLIIYDVNTRTLLPRPRGLLAVPDTPTNREEVRKAAGTLELFGATKESNGQLLIAFDQQSIPAYERESFAEASVPATEWAARVDPKRLVPILDDLGDNAALRLAAPRLYRSVRDLRGWTRYLTAAESIEAEASTGGGIEELRVRMAAK